FGLAPSSEPVTFTTAAREQGNVTLADGSKVRIDVSTSLAVQITHEERSIELKQGRALFEVAGDPLRPFSVQVGAGRIVALGTRFQVQREGERVVVTLAEGAVLVRSQGGPDGPVHEERLSPGEQVIYATDASFW